MCEKIDFILMRHGYDDHSYIDGLNDTSLTERGINETKQAAKNLALQLGDLNQNIAIRSSSKKRSTETSEIIAEQFERDKISYTYSVDQNLRELYQGNMDLDGLSHEEKVNLLQSAWEAFDKERANGNDNYRFGQPHAGLIREFVNPPFGESQNQFTLRIAKSFSSIIDEQLSMYNFPIIITHRGGIREIKNMTHAFNNKIPVSQSQVVEMSGLKYNEILNNTICDTRFCANALRKRITRLNGKIVL